MCDAIGLQRPPDEEAERIAADTVSYVKAHLELRPPQGGLRALRALRARGLVLHVASADAHDELVAFLEQIGVRDLFDRVYGSDLVNTWKVGPEYYRAVLANCGGSHSKRAAPCGASTRGRSATQRRITSSPSAPATTASRGSNASELRAPAHLSTEASGRYGRFAQTRSTRSVIGASRSPRRNSTRSATPPASAFACATASASRDESVAITRTRGSCAAMATAIAPDPV